MRYLVFRYNNLIKNPASATGFNLPILAGLEWEDVRTWNIEKQISMLLNGPADLLRVTLGIQDRYSKDTIIRLEWEELDPDVVEIIDDLYTARGMQQPGGAMPGVNFTPDIKPATGRPLRQRHRYQLDTVSPWVKDASLVEWDLPKSCVAYKCECANPFFCEEIIKRFMQVGLPAKPLDVLRQNGSMEISVPVFGHVLHRIHATYELVENNWSGEKVQRFSLSTMDYFAPTRTVFFDWEDGSQPPNILNAAFNTLRWVITANRESELLHQKFSEVQNFVQGSGNLLCKNSVPRGRTGRIQHNFGTNKQLIEWHREAPGDTEEYGERIYANVHCLLTYGECYWCYKNNDIIFIMPSL